MDCQSTSERLPTFGTRSRASRASIILTVERVEGLFTPGSRSSRTCRWRIARPVRKSRTCSAPNLAGCRIPRKTMYRLIQPTHVSSVGGCSTSFCSPRASTRGSSPVQGGLTSLRRRTSRCSRPGTGAGQQVAGVRGGSCLNPPSRAKTKGIVTSWHQPHYIAGRGVCQQFPAYADA